MGSFLIILLPSGTSPNEIKEKATDIGSHVGTFIQIGLLDVAGNTLTVVGLTYSGSGIYQVVYSSVVLFGALFSKLLLGKSLNKSQWIGLMTIVLGLSLSALGSTATPGNNQTLGIILTLLGTMLYGLSYVAAEKTLNTIDAPTSSQLQVFSSLVGLGVLFTYFLVYVSPNWYELFTKPVIEKQGHMPTILLLYLSLMFSGLLQNYAYFKIIGSSGAVTTGVLQALRAIAVFVLSSILFCSTDSNQCMNMYKTISAAFVVLGVIYYSRSNIQEEKPIA